MNGFGTLWRTRTHKNIHTLRSLRTHTGPGRASWPRCQETEQLTIEAKRLAARQRWHDQRRALWTSQSSMGIVR